MKRCEYTQSDLFAYLHNRMSTEEESTFQRHLLTCDSCANKLRRLRRTITFFKGSSTARKWWLVGTAIACSIAAGIYIIHSEQIELSTSPHQFNYMPPKNYHHCDTLESDSTSLDKDSTDYNTEIEHK